MESRGGHRRREGDVSSGGGAGVSVGRGGEDCLLVLEKGSKRFLCKESLKSKANVLYSTKKINFNLTKKSTFI